MSSRQSPRRAKLSPGFEGYYDFAEAGFPTRQALETRGWRAAEALTPPAGMDAHGRRVFAWANAVGAGHLRDAAAAKAAEARYRATWTSAELKTADAHPSSAWIETQAWILFAQGRTDAALALMRPLADTQDRVGKGEVEPPAREMMADMLRLDGRFDEALAQYRMSLRTDPSRLDAVRDLAETATRLHSSR